MSLSLRMPTSLSVRPSRRIYHETVAERIASELRERIVRWEFAPGERLRQADLAEEFEVSQASVRDALRQLEVDGLAISHPRRGVSVADLSAGEISDLYDMLIALETMALRSAVSGLRPEDLGRARQAIALPATGDDPISVARRQIGFIEALYTPSARRSLLNEIRRLRLFTVRYLRGILPDTDQALPVDTGYEAVIDACERGDADGAVSLLNKLYVKERDGMTDAIESHFGLRRAAD